jgi:hypothetical protein
MIQPTIVRTLGIQPEHRVCLRGVTNPIFAAMVIANVDYPPSDAASGRFDTIVFQIDDEESLTDIAELASHLEQRGNLWILHPSSVDRSPTKERVRSAGLAAGLVPSKTFEYSVTHTATRYTRPVKVISGTI